MKMNNQYKPDNIFPLTKEEILEHFEHVFDNPFQKRTIEAGAVWNVWNDRDHHSWFGNGHTKGYSTSAILINAQGEKDYVEFWRFYKDGKWCNGYSFKKRELFPTILN